jgi:protein tyrosine/serine phosphatase
MTPHAEPAAPPRLRVTGIRPLLRWLSVGVLVFAAALAAYRSLAASAYDGEKVTIDGIANFGRVGPHLYRGAQPSEAGFQALRRLGVDLVVSFTLGDESIADEAARVHALGMAHLSLPWSVTSEPTSAEVATFLALFNGSSNRTIFVHCKQGADRTGVMIALYRIAHDGWTSSQAVDEMAAFHFYELFHPHLQGFVEDFAATRALAQQHVP